jgi:hypothetical protein
MTQIAAVAAEAALNVLSGQFALSVGSSAPTYVPGLYWWNTSGTPALYGWNGSAWISLANRYLALLYANPATSGPGGGPAVLMSDLVECTDTGYARQPVTFTPASPISGSSVPVQAANTASITFGPFGIDMTGTAGWVALVTAATGTGGLYLYEWDVPSNQTQRVLASQSISLPAGTLTLDQA